jgi:hypothetical protein
MIRHADSLVGKELCIWDQTAAGFLAPMVKCGQVSFALWQLWYWIRHITRLLLIDSVCEADQELYLVRKSAVCSFSVTMLILCLHTG